jgi:hypothetical protein
VAICDNCGKWYLTNPFAGQAAPTFANPQQRKFYMLKRVFKIVRITIAAVVLLLILKSVMGN